MAFVGGIERFDDEKNNGRVLKSLWRVKGGYEVLDNSKVLLVGVLYVHVAVDYELLIVSEIDLLCSKIRIWMLSS